MSLRIILTQKQHDFNDNKSLSRKWSLCWRKSDDKMLGEDECQRGEKQRASQAGRKTWICLGSTSRSVQLIEQRGL